MSQVYSLGYFASVFCCWARRSQLRRLAAFVVLILGSIVVVESCGSGGNSGAGGNGGTPLGITNAVITLRSGGTTHSLVFTINVQ